MRFAKHFAKQKR
jgi:hypothetical protein